MGWSGRTLGRPESTGPKAAGTRGQWPRVGIGKGSVYNDPGTEQVNPPSQSPGWPWAHSGVIMRPKVSFEVGGPHVCILGSRAWCTPPHTSVPPLLQVPGCRSALRNGQSDCTAQAAGERTLLAEGLETAMAPVPAERVGLAHRCVSPRALHTAHVSPEGLWLHTEDGGGSFRTPSHPPPPITQAEI